MSQCDFAVLLRIFLQEWCSISNCVTLITCPFFSSVFPPLGDSLDRAVLCCWTKTRPPRRQRRSGERKPKRSWRTGMYTRVSRWRRTRPTTGECLTLSPVNAQRSNRWFIIMTRWCCNQHAELSLIQINKSSVVFADCNVSHQKSLRILPFFCASQMHCVAETLC